MTKTVLRITLDKKLKDDVTKLAKENGFKNLSELTRYWFISYLNGKLKMTVEFPPMKNN